VSKVTINRSPNNTWLCSGHDFLFRGSLKDVVHSISEGVHGLNQSNLWKFVKTGDVFVVKRRDSF